MKVPSTIRSIASWKKKYQFTSTTSRTNKRQQLRRSIKTSNYWRLVTSPNPTLRKTRSVKKIYQTRNLKIVESDTYEKNFKQDVWRKAMEEKNKNWEEWDLRARKPSLRRRSHRSQVDLQNKILPKWLN